LLFKHMHAWLNILVCGTLKELYIGSPSSSELELPFVLRLHL